MVTRAARFSMRLMPPQGKFQQLITSLLTLGSFVSSLVAGVFAHYFGRRVALWVACALSIIACATQIASDNKIAIYIGRLILGLANGFLVTFSSIYTAEAAPAHLRAVMVSPYRSLNPALESSDCHRYCKCHTTGAGEV